MVGGSASEGDVVLFVIAVILGVTMTVLQLYGGSVAFAFIAGGAAWRWRRRRRE